MVPTSTNAGRAWWAAEADAVVTDLETDAAAGLTAAEAYRRLEADGPNELDEEPGRRPALIFGAQFANTMIIVLLIAAAVTLVIGDTKDAIVITAIVTLNAIIGFVQEYRAEQAMAALRTMAAPHARVVREATESTIPATELVSGDLIILEAGDIVPADARLIESPNLRVNEATLTGESVPVDKTSTSMHTDAGELVGDRLNMVFKGTSVVAGRATAVIVATGMRTALGGIAELLKSHQAPSTPLQKRLAVLGRRLAAAALIICVIVFTVGVLRGEDVELMFLTAVSLAVAAIPEALPAVVTIALALGAQRMAEQGALIRKLPAVETLGSVTVICSDKTGTLTQGRMLAEKVWTFEGEVQATGDGYSPDGDLIPVDGVTSAETSSLIGRLVLAGALCNDAVLIAPDQPDGAWSVAGDPTEGALLALAAKAGFDRDGLRETYERIEEIPFDADRKRMTTLHRTPGDGTMLLASKGAIEPILESCTSHADHGGDMPLTDAAVSRIMGQVMAYSAAGYRVLAIAGRPLDHLADPDTIETDLVLYGLVAMADPARPESAGAVEACRTAGIIPVMITGDHPATGEAIANRLGILGDREVLTGSRLAAEHAEGLTEHVDRVGVYARTSPGQKLDIVRAWKERGDIVAMTGDGVNDAPALRSADIGVAMGITGTEVAKEAADMVLTDDNFATIVTAVGEGRRIYDNIRRFVRYTLTSNSGEIWVMFLGPFVGLPLPLLPVQILWINLVTDGLPGLALGVEPAERDVMKRPPRPPDESVFARGLWQHVAVVGLLMGLIPLALGLWGNATGRPWQTMVFTSLALLQLGNALAVRSEIDSLRSLGLGSNRPLLMAVAGTLLLQLAVLFWAPARDLLKIEALSLFELGVVLVASTGVLWAVEFEKLVRRRRRANGPAGSALPSATSS
ncbi:MAG: cation-translocating P-type ATPase [Acidimicrobiia bacterium]|nr:cation-translocating P-type ATPase [Acidimicrobiia bacterium]